MQKNFFFKLVFSCILKVNENRRIRIRIRIHSLRLGSADPDPHPDPRQNVMDPQHHNHFTKVHAAWGSSRS
jgi:hypothetical protein